MKRLLILLGLAAVVAAGCGSSDPADDAGSDGVTRTIDTERGPVTVPAEAERVVAADYYGQYSLFDLGIVPVGISGGAPFNEPYASAVADVPIVGDWQDPFVVQSAAVTPDLILRTIDTEDAVYDQLTQIAPTVEISFQQLSLKEVILAVGEAVGRSEEAAALIADYDDRASTIATDHAEVLSTTKWVTFSPADGGQWFLLSPAWTDNAVLADAGIRFADAVVELGATSDDYSAERSLEVLSDLADADVILVPADTEGEIDLSMEPFLDSPIWQALPAVSAQNVYAAPSGTSSIGMANELLARLAEILPLINPVPR